MKSFFIVKSHNWTNPVSLSVLGIVRSDSCETDCFIRRQGKSQSAVELDGASNLFKNTFEKERFHFSVDLRANLLFSNALQHGNRHLRLPRQVDWQFKPHELVRLDAQFRQVMIDYAS